MITLHVDAPGGRYPIVIGAGAALRLAPWLRKAIRPSSLHVVTDSRVAPLHGDFLLQCLAPLKVPVRLAVVPAGEASKSLRAYGKLCRELIRAGVDRCCCLVAFGGGVIGDLVGFAAASLLRGVSYIQMPTTLLAMVDSSVGGKTGINLPEGKNLLGAFHQPKAVFADTNFLRTLGKRELNAGWAEIIKAGAIADPRLFARLEKDHRRLTAAARRGLEEVIRDACRVKVEVVNADEREAGPRMALNFGHTLAHGLEAAGSYAGLLHGEAVAIGMVFAARLALALGLAAEETASRLEALLPKFGLPASAPSSKFHPAEVLKAMRRDKKSGPQGQRWVFVPRIGKVEIHSQVPGSAVEAALEGFLGA